MARRNDTFPYEDIVGLPHPVSRRHRPMPPENRAAQFLPFAALTGYEAEVNEAARFTDERIELSEDQKAALDACLKQLAEASRLAGDGPGQPEAAFTCFVPDSRKEGGSYTTVKGRLKRVDGFRRAVQLTDGTWIPIENILDIRCEGPHQYGPAGG